MTRDPIKILADIMKVKLSLADDQIIIYNQAPKMEKSGLYVVIQEVGTSHILSQNKSYIFENDKFYEVQTLVSKQEFLINLISKNNEAKLKKNLALIALNSQYASELELKYGVAINKKQNTIANVSSVEGSSMLNRFTILVAVMSRDIVKEESCYYDSIKIENIIHE